MLLTYKRVNCPPSLLSNCDHVNLFILNYMDSLASQENLEFFVLAGISFKKNKLVILILILKYDINQGFFQTLFKALCITKYHSRAVRTHSRYASPFLLVVSATSIPTGTALYVGTGQWALEYPTTYVSIYQQYFQITNQSSELRRFSSCRPAPHPPRILCHPSPV